MLSAPERDHSDFRHNEDSCQAAKWEAICHFTISSYYGHAGHDKWDDVILQSVQTARSFFFLCLFDFNEPAFKCLFEI